MGIEEKDMMTDSKSAAAKAVATAAAKRDRDRRGVERGGPGGGPAPAGAGGGPSAAEANGGGMEMTGGGAGGGANTNAKNQRTNATNGGKAPNGKQGTAIDCRHQEVAHSLNCDQYSYYTLLRTEEPEFEPVTLELLKEMRVYQRLMRREANELEDVRREQVRERQAMQRAHCESMDKLVVAGDKLKRHLKGERVATTARYSTNPS